MKILFLSENYFPNVSGVPVVVKYLAEGLISKGNHVTIATQSFKNEPLKDNINGVDVFRFKIWKNKLHGYCGEKKSYVSFVKSFGADVIIIECSQCITTDLILPHLKNIPGKKIFHSHGFSGMDSPFFKIKTDIIHTLGTTYNWTESKLYFGYILKRRMKYFDVSLCLSEVDNSKPYLEKFSKKVFVLDNAAENMFFENIDNAKEVLSKYIKLEHDSFIVSCANYQYVKDQISIIRQFYQSSESIRTSLVCIGSQKNDYYKKCESIVEINEKIFGHRDVHLLVGVARNDIPPIINQAKLYIVASRCERYSISIIEAMSQGVPFVSTDVGNAKNLPGGVTVDSLEDIHKQIDLFLTNKSLHKKYSLAGKKFAYSNCRIDAVVDKLNMIISNL